MEKKFMKLFEDAFDYCEEGNYLQALKCYDEILTIEPQNIGALIDKGTTLQNLGKLKTSIKFYDKALSLNRNNLDALVNKGSALHSLGLFSQAIVCYDLALKIDKKCAMAFAYKGLSLGEQGKVKEALKFFKKKPLVSIRIMTLRKSVKILHKIS